MGFDLRPILREAARSTLEVQGVVDHTTFCDEAGHRRAVDGPFIAWCTNHRLTGSAPLDATLDVRLWWALHDERSTIVDDILARASLDPDLTLWTLAQGHAEVGLEVATETQLCSLHALTWHAHRLRERTLVRIALASALWLSENLQPDNGTNHPWGIHAFWFAAFARDRRRSSDDLFHYCGTLFHNCRVNLGRPDRLSAWILWDAARAMEVIKKW